MHADRALKDGRVLIYRHGLVVRISHWLNLACLLILLPSGLQILCAHPAFYWGETARFAHPWMAVSTRTIANGDLRGRLTGPGLDLDSTGILGVSKASDGSALERALPRWATLPEDLDLGAGRRWHFFFAWVFVINGGVYLAQGLVSRRLPKAMIPTRDQLAHLGASIWDHLRLKFDQGEAARGYNALQKLAYLPVVFGLLPLMLLTGLAMSPMVDARLHLLPELLGGRQRARTLHFLSASGLVLFVLIHVLMVIAAGPIRTLRPMITGWFALKPQDAAP